MNISYLEYIFVKTIKVIWKNCMKKWNNHNVSSMFQVSGQAMLADTDLKCLLVANPCSIPEQPVGGYVCEYDYGKCLETFDSFHSFLTHLSCHIYAFSDTCDDNIVCRWANCSRLTPFDVGFFFIYYALCDSWVWRESVKNDIWIIRKILLCVGKSLLTTAKANFSIEMIKYSKVYKCWAFSESIFRKSEFDRPAGWW